MAIELQLATQASAPQVLAALRELDGRGVPAPLERWTRGSARSVVAKVRGRRFRLFYKRAWFGPEYDSLVVRGTVESTPTGGAMIRASTGQKVAGLITTILFLGGSAMWMAKSGGSEWWWVVGILGVVLLLTAGIDANVSRADDEARYLIECVEDAAAGIASDGRINAPTA
jgi:hypothetical protein